MRKPGLQNMTDQLRLRLRQAPLLLLATAALAWSLLHGSAFFRAEWLSMGARQSVDTWARNGSGWTVEEWQATRTALLQALQLTPDDPVLHVTLAQLYVTQGLAGWRDPSQREAYFSEALEHQQTALRLRPTDGPTWASLAVSLFVLGRPAEFQAAWLQARYFAPREAPVQRTLIDLAVATWDDATPGMREWALLTWRAAGPVERAVFKADAKRRGRSDLLQ
jgi:tetratricopeptide (TPR) repeat protein